MTIDLSDDLSGFIREQVNAGRYGSADEVLRDALGRLREQIRQVERQRGSLGAMSDAAEDLDEVVAHAMRHRERPWRETAGE